jgi:hypothetical protein
MDKNDEPEHLEIGLRLKKFRKWQGLYNQKEFAIEHGFSVTQYTGWEVGHRRIPIEHAAVLEERYRLTLDYLYLGRVSTLPHNLVTALSDNPLDK